ncbi:hypothetical protein SAMN04489752_3521 [Brevibacterium siliguriense]|uniref:Uncharacterized protein n=2 Tax=Brevibacterium siliguriense TaxID=1136497 RepID=A0A1H1Y245_9MICO|nr:hypothetical protein SAMN04489752_3521 [Brevibacterium siliguriense]
MPADGSDFDRRRSAISYRMWIVSPKKTGALNRQSLTPRNAVIGRSLSS